VEVGGLKNTDRILDIGCGPGRMPSSHGQDLNITKNLKQNLKGKYIEQPN